MLYQFIFYQYVSKKDICYTLQKNVFLERKKVCILDKNFHNALLCGINLQITNKNIDFKREGESTCVGVSRGCLSE